jgi:putative ABC transport system permease protein
MLRDFIADVGYAVRGMGRGRVLTIAAALTLSVAIAANTTMFSLVNTILIRPLPYPDSQNIYRVTERMGRDPRGIAVGADYYSLREQNKVFVDVAAFDTFTMNWPGIEKPEALFTAQVTPSFFTVMGTKPMLGRYLAEREEGPSAPAVVVISYTFWRNRLGSDPGAVGKTILLNGASNQICRRNAAGVQLSTRHADLETDADGRRIAAASIPQRPAASRGDDCSR